ncbi:hypothetical protein [Nonomuraea sp. NPDC001023]|uniref:hypothetical protein n=1 Tax=unclassified Nonomuraea TaxID=2593643 RepID=UPI003319232B
MLDADHDRLITAVASFVDKGGHSLLQLRHGLIVSDQKAQGFGRLPGRQLPLRIGFLLRELVDQVGEGSPVVLGQVLQETATGPITCIVAAGVMASSLRSSLMTTSVKALARVR